LLRKSDAILGVLGNTSIRFGSLAFILSVLLAVLALLVRYAHVAIPWVSSHSFETPLIGFLLLLAGNLFKGF